MREEALLVLEVPNARGRATGADERRGRPMLLMSVNAPFGELVFLAVFGKKQQIRYMQFLGKTANYKFAVLVVKAEKRQM